MASLRILRRRIRSTQNTKQIMRAMQLVSGSKLRRSQARLLEARAVLEFLDGLLQRVLAATGQLAHPLCDVREAGASALVVLTSDAGLCGAYNANLIQLTEAELRRDSAATTQLITVGKKGHRYVTKHGYQPVESYLDLAGRPNLETAAVIGRSLMTRFLSGGVGSIRLLYSQFVSPMVYRPTIRQWLPIHLDQPNARTGKRASISTDEYIFEPSPERIFEDLLPRWALATFQLVMLEAFTSEHSARMIAMKNATDNAEELVGELTRQRNRIRQAAITKEISEIVGTAEALK